VLDLLQLCKLFWKKSLSKSVENLKSIRDDVKPKGASIDELVILGDLFDLSLAPL